MLLKLWRTCSELAATRNFYKATYAAMAAYVTLQCTQKASTSAVSIALTQQLGQSGLLEHLPSLITDAALQLQAVAGVWPASAQAADKTRFEPMLHVWHDPGLFS